MNYHGSKGKFYEQIEPILPKDDKVLCLDLFAGGTSLSSMLPDTWRIVCNDNCYDVGRLQAQFLSDYKDSSRTAEEWVACVASESLVKNKSDKDSYLKLKEDYNQLKDSERWERSYVFFELVCSSFSNYIRFNEKGEWNLQFGNRYFNPSMQKKLVAWLKRMENKDVDFCYADWKHFNLSEYDFLIVDPPYLKTCAQYNSSWTEQDTLQLLEEVDKYVEQGGKFILFEEVLSKGTPNNIIAEWMKKYNHINLGDESKGCNYQRKDGITLEVCIYN